MARLATGSMKTDVLADGSKAFRVRVRDGRPGKRPRVTLHERQGCRCCDGGGWDDRSAKIEMKNIVDEIRLGVWEPPPDEATSAEAGSAEGAPDFYSALADWFVAGKVSGELARKGPISENTKLDLEWRLSYSKEYFAESSVIEIDMKRSIGFKRWLFQKSAAERKAIEAGVDLRDRRGRRCQPLGLSSIKKVIDTYAAVMDEAVEEELREGNPGRSRRMQISVPKPERTYLEMDELAVLFEAANEQETAIPAGLLDEVAGTTADVVRLASLGKRPKQIATDLDLAKSTVTYHLRKGAIDLGRGYVGRRVVCELLGRGGLRASEVCDLRIADVRLHEPGGATVRIVDAKTEAGERVVMFSPDGTEALVEHLDRLRRAGLPTGPTDYLVPNTRGGRMTRQRIWKIVKEAAELAIERLAERDLPPLQRTTPHTLRRTYISIALLASKFDLKWVMDQVGHADSTMTTDVYAQLQHRIERRHGPEFDRLVRQAAEQMVSPPGAPAIGTGDVPGADAARLVVGGVV